MHGEHSHSLVHGSPKGVTLNRTRHIYVPSMRKLSKEKTLCQLPSTKAIIE
jgi:hypothetical protein